MDCGYCGRPMSGKCEICREVDGEVITHYYECAQTGATVPIPCAAWQPRKVPPCGDRARLATKGW